jgi:hypothetical protein
MYPRPPCTGRGGGGEVAGAAPAWPGGDPETAAGGGEETRFLTFHHIETLRCTICMENILTAVSSPTRSIIFLRGKKQTYYLTSLNWWEGMVSTSRFPPLLAWGQM